ncbi:RidA family protein [Pararhizobium arenae]|uniref:RidA family protein n=1 Tax=Pararhizobium arenae TaxID=1856850 RepID=UPI00094AC645|nr:Rid family hydrolase [Pararhizobium arenae]
MEIQRNTPDGLYKLKGAHQVVRVGNTVYLSGLVACRADGSVAGSDAATQVRQTYENMKVALASVGADLSSVVKTITYLTHASQYKDVQSHQVELFGQNGPANSTVIVSGLAWPELLIEIEAIAYLPEDAK